MKLQGKRAVVTGAGRGIGTEIARQLAAEGCHLVVAARTASEIEALAQELGNTHAQPCDVSQPDSIRALAAFAQERLGGVDILINNAGVSSSAPVKSLALEEWNRVIAINATGAFLCSQAFLPGMTASGWGRIITIASVASLGGGKYMGAYAASKHAVLGFTRCLAQETARSGVTANAICPGFVNTPMTQATIDNIVRTTGRTREQALEALTRSNPQGRLIEPEEIAHVVLFLCDPLACGINGQALVIDGGGLQP
jgi:3-hydroxybutyrate dehydrogenase